ncbi:MAG: TRAP transporter small permease [Treponemataceae bacterium]
MSLLVKMNGGLIKMANFLVIISMAAIAIVIPYEVFCRYVLNSMNTWSSEFCMYSLVWASMLGGAAGLSKGFQVGITSLIDSLSKKNAKILQGVIYVLILIFTAIMTFYGTFQVFANLRQTSSSMGISMSIPYAALPLGFFIMFTTTLEQLLELPGLQSGGRN